MPEWDQATLRRPVQGVNVPLECESKSGGDADEIVRRALQKSVIYLMCPCRSFSEKFIGRLHP